MASIPDFYNRMGQIQLQSILIKPEVTPGISLTYYPLQEQHSQNYHSLPKVTKVIA